jgi:hypothetical protein
MTQINCWGRSKFGGLIDQCHTMGAEAHTLAVKGSDEKRAQYLLLAAAWAELAQDIQCATIGSSRSAE